MFAVAVAVAVAVWLTFDLMLLPTLDFGQRGDQGAWVGCAGRYFFTCGQFEGIWYVWVKSDLPTTSVPKVQQYVRCVIAFWCGDRCTLPRCVCTTPYLIPRSV